MREERVLLKTIPAPFPQNKLREDVLRVEGDGAGGRVVQGEVLEGDRGQVVALQGREVGGSGGLAEGETDVGQVGGDLGGGVGAWGRRGDGGGGLEDHGGGGGGVGDVGLILVLRREGGTSMPSEKETSLHNQQPWWSAIKRVQRTKGERQLCSRDRVSEN